MGLFSKHFSIIKLILGIVIGAFVLYLIFKGIVQQQI